MASSSSAPSTMQTPRYTHETINNGVISLWKFERDYCQSRYGHFSDSGTNSCTLIALLTANYIAKNKIDTYCSSSVLSGAIIDSFSKCIDRGNQNYNRLTSTKKIENVNLSIPEARLALQNSITHIQEWFFVHINVPNDEMYSRKASGKLHTVLDNGIQMWLKTDFPKAYIFIIIIAANRTILLTYQRNHRLFTLYDSHHHSETIGALIAQAKYENLSTFSSWLIEMFNTYYFVKPAIFEISFMLVKD